MSTRVVSVQPRSSGEELTETAIQRMLNAEGLQAYHWSSAPGEVYEEQIYPYRKIIYVVDGSMTIYLPQPKQHITLHYGDRIELPGRTVYSLISGPEGVVCLEAHRWEDAEEQPKA